MSIHWGGRGPGHLSRNGKAAGGALSLDFTAGAMPSAATLTRASNGTYFDASGVMQTAGADIARFDYNPVSHVALGLLIEPAATNLFTFSEQFDNAAWTKLGSTVSANSSAAPDGASTADKLVDDSSSGRHSVFCSVTVNAAQSYTVSVFQKASGRSYGGVRITANADGTPDYGSAFDLAGAALGGSTFSGTPVGAARAVAAAGGSFARCSVTITTDSTTSFPVISNSDSATPTWANASPSYLGDGSSGTLIWGAQIEAGSAATSYIPTTSATATRAADALTVTVPAGYGHLTVTFDDNSTQTVACSTGANTYHASDFNRTRIKSMVGAP